VVPVLAAMAIEVPFLVIGVLRWRNPVPRPGVVLGALLAATASTMVASAISVALAQDSSQLMRADRNLALAGAALAVLVHVAARRPRPRASEPIACARAISRRRAMR
jgi:peptidoglycan/LPS O-acetylase OafA/YrhL